MPRRSTATPSARAAAWEHGGTNDGSLRSSIGYPMLAPKECDLMFSGRGHGFMPYNTEHEEKLFYRGYGPPPLDSVALAY